MSDAKKKPHMSFVFIELKQSGFKVARWKQTNPNLERGLS
jgi:hypothetical protein